MHPELPVSSLARLVRWRAGNIRALSWRLKVSALVLMWAPVAGCSSGESDQLVTNASDETPPMWEFGGNEGERFGPFANIFGTRPAPNEKVTASGWVSVVLPSGDPIEAFYAVVEDATDQGFTAFVHHDGTCRQLWQREKVNYGDNWDGDDFNGETPFGVELPNGAAVIGVACEAVVERREDRMLISMRTALDDAPPGSDRPPAIVLTDAAPQDFGAPFEERQGLDVDAARRTSGNRTLILETHQAACGATVARTTAPPITAITDALEATPNSYIDHLTTQPTATTVGDHDAAVLAEAVPAGGPVVYVAATQSGTGTDVLVCYG